jgi:hypothetical protein
VSLPYTCVLVSIAVHASGVLCDSFNLYSLHACPGGASPADGKSSDKKVEKEKPFPKVLFNKWMGANIATNPHSLTGNPYYPCAIFYWPAGETCNSC